jgi:hypothetical protein
MRASDVTFRNHVVDETVPVDQRKETEVIEIRLPDGTVGVFPATDIDGETGQRYCDLYGPKYAAFKKGEPDADRVAQLEREIAERQAELKTLRAVPAKAAPVNGEPDDEPKKKARK